MKLSPKTIGLMAGAGLAVIVAAAGFAVAQQATEGPPAATPAPAGGEEAPPATVNPPPPIAIVPTPPAPVTPAAPPPEAKQAANPAPDAPPPPPLRRPRSPYAVLQVLDKVTAETLRFQVPVGGAVRYKTLIFQVKACETNAADEDQADSIAYVTVTSQPLSPGGGVPPPAKQVFKGWMYASSPGLDPLQHPVYDAWVIACTGAPAGAPK